MEDKSNLYSYQLLKTREELANEKFANLSKKNEEQRLKELKDILNLIETKDKFNFELLKILKEKGENSEYEKYLERLFYTITDDHLIELKENNELNLFKVFVSAVKGIISNESNYSLPDKYKAIFSTEMELNYPLIDSIEKARLALYIHYVIKGKNKTALSKFLKYVEIIEEDLKNINLNSEELNIKLYLFVLHFTYIKKGTKALT